MLVYSGGLSDKLVNIYLVMDLVKRFNGFARLLGNLKWNNMCRSKFINLINLIARKRTSIGGNKPKEVILLLPINENFNSSHFIFRTQWQYKKLISVRT